MLFGRSSLPVDCYILVIIFCTSIQKKSYISLTLRQWFALTKFQITSWNKFKELLNDSLIFKRKVFWKFTGPNPIIPIFIIKANHLAYIVPRWYRSRIYPDYQQKLFSLGHDTGGRILLVTFLVEQKKEYDAQR